MTKCPEIVLKLTTDLVLKFDLLLLGSLQVCEHCGSGVAGSWNVKCRSRVVSIMVEDEKIQYCCMLMSDAFILNWSINRVQILMTAGVIAGDAASAGCQVTLCDPVWHAGPCSGAMLLAWADVLLYLYLLSWCRLATLCNVGEDTSDITDIELIQHINVDCARLTKLLSGMYFHFVVLVITSGQSVLSTGCVNLYSTHWKIPVSPASQNAVWQHMEKSRCQSSPKMLPISCRDLDAI